VLTVLTLFSTDLRILITLIPARPSRLNVMSTPSTRRKCLRPTQMAVHAEHAWMDVFWRKAFDHCRIFSEKYCTHEGGTVHPAETARPGSTPRSAHVPLSTSSALTIRLPLSALTRRRPSISKPSAG
jgi:hypothetical protein